MNHKTLPNKHTLFILRLDSALAKRRGETKTVEGERRQCEGCFQWIPRYEGPEPGVLCQICLTAQISCTRIMPLAITRSTLNE